MNRNFFLLDFQPWSRQRRWERERDLIDVRFVSHQIKVVEFVGESPSRFHQKYFQLIRNLSRQDEINFFDSVEEFPLIPLIINLKGRIGTWFMNVFLSWMKSEANIKLVFWDYFVWEKSFFIWFLMRILSSFPFQVFSWNSIRYQRCKNKISRKRNGINKRN